MNKEHKWQKGSLQGFQAFRCEKCLYIVVAYPELKDEIEHLPEDRVILTRKDTITDEDCNLACQTCGVECKVG